MPRTRKRLALLAILPVVVLTGHSDTQLAFHAIEEGAQDYLVKNDVNAPRLVHALRFAISRFQQQHAVEKAHRANEAERIEDFLGVELNAKLRAYLDTLAGQTVCGRTTDQIVADDAARAALLTEVDDDLDRAPAAVKIADPAQAERTFLSYLHAKLK